MAVCIKREHTGLQLKAEQLHAVRQKVLISSAPPKAQSTVLMPKPSVSHSSLERSVAKCLVCSMASQHQHTSVAHLTDDVSTGLEAVYAGGRAEDDCENPGHAQDAKGGHSHCVALLVAHQHQPNPARHAPCFAASLT